MREQAGDGPPDRVLVIRSLAAEQTRFLPRRRRRRPVAPAAGATPVTTIGATVVIPAELPGEEAARAWLADAGEELVEDGLRVINEAIRAHRLASADPHAREVARASALVVRAGYGDGERVAEGRWVAAVELPPPRAARLRRTSALRPQERLAALIGGRERALACEELTLRARVDLDAGREREGAFQLMAALDAALRELAGDAALSERLAELDTRFKAVVGAAGGALAGPLDDAGREVLRGALGRLEAALRARSAAGG